MTVPNYIIEIERIKNTWDLKWALEYTNEVLKKNISDYRLYEELADINLFLKKFDKASELLEIANKLNPNSATWKYLKWYVEITSWDVDLWIELLEEANKLSPNNPEILRNLWWGYVMVNNFIKWINVLKRALNLLEWDPLIMEDLWVALANNWEIEEARFYLKQVNKEHIIDRFKINE